MTRVINVITENSAIDVITASSIIDVFVCPATEGAIALGGPIEWPDGEEMLWPDGNAILWPN